MLKRRRVQESLVSGPMASQSNVVRANEHGMVVEEDDGLVVTFKGLPQFVVPSGPDPDTVLLKSYLLVVSNGNATLASSAGALYTFPGFVVSTGSVIELKTGELIGVLGTVSSQLVRFDVSYRGALSVSPLNFSMGDPIGRVAVCESTIYFSVKSDVYYVTAVQGAMLFAADTGAYVTGLAVSEYDGTVAVMTSTNVTLYSNKVPTFKACDFGMEEVGFVKDQCVIASSDRGQAYLTAYPSNIRFSVCGTQMSTTDVNVTVCGNNLIMTFVTPDTEE